MSVWAKKWAYEQHPKRLDEDRKLTDKKHPAAKAVLVALAEYPGVGQRVCWPSQKTLADMTDFTERQVRACLRDLEDQGFIEREERRRGDGSRRSDRVTLLGPPEDFGPSQDSDDQPEESSGGGGREFRGDPEESSGHEPSVGNRNGSRRASDDAPFPDIEGDTFGFFVRLANAQEVIITPEDRTQTARHFKDLKRLYQPTRLELNRVVAKMLEARTSGFEMSPQKALGKVRGTDGRHLRAVPTEPQREFKALN